jgi:23S rRNA (cytosine1962-C5)-methyltransferase
LFGEADGLPGLTVDRYNDYAVVQPYLDDAGPLLGWLVAALRQTDGLQGVILRRNERRSSSAEDAVQRPEDASSAAELSSIVYGTPPPPDLIITEQGLRFYADLLAGQKTGLFLDQRENRRFVEGIAGGRTVLNCFAYTGAFGLYALRGGARNVVDADSGKGLAAAADANIALNRLLDASCHSFITADCFELLSQYVQQGRQFDLVILDPPSFAKKKQQRYAALRAYTRLNTLGLRCVAPGGLLATASCTSQVGGRRRFAKCSQRPERRPSAGSRSSTRPASRSITPYRHISPRDAISNLSSRGCCRSLDGSRYASAAHSS